MSKKFYEEPTFDYITITVNNELLTGSGIGENTMIDISDESTDDFFS